MSAVPAHSDTSPDLRTRILEAAVTLFAHKGYGSTSVREVVEAVGCTKPALYYHFGSKEELYLEAVQTRLREVVGVLEASVSSPGTAAARLERFARALLARVRERPDGVRLVLTAEHRPAGDTSPEVDLLSLHMEMLGRLAALLEQGREAGEVRSDLPAEELALAFIGMLHVHTMAALYGVEPDVDAPAQILDIFFSGARPRE